jgi:hypothetical protein
MPQSIRRCSSSQGFQKRFPNYPTNGDRRIIQKDKVSLALLGIFDRLREGHPTDVQQLLSMFPSGLPGIALLLAALMAGVAISDRAFESTASAIH